MIKVGNAKNGGGTPQNICGTIGRSGSSSAAIASVDTLAATRVLYSGLSFCVLEQR